MRIGDKPGRPEVPDRTTSGRWATPARAARAARSSTTTARSAGRPAGLARGRRRPLHRDLEPRVHAVQPRRAGRDASAAQALRRHRHGPGAHRRGAAGRALELRDRPLPGPDQGRGARDRAPKDLEEPVAQGHRRPHPRLRVPDRRRRDPGQRRPRLRAAPDHPPRDPPRLQARAEAAVLPPPGRRPRRGDGRRLSRSCAQPKTARRARC